MENSAKDRYLTAATDSFLRTTLKKMIKHEINYFLFAYVEATQTVRHECVFFYLFCGFVVFLPSAEGALSPPSFLNAIVIG